MNWTGIQNSASNFEYSYSLLIKDGSQCGGSTKSNIPTLGVSNNYDSLSVAIFYMLIVNIPGLRNFIHIHLYSRYLDHCITFMTPDIDWYLIIFGDIRVTE